MRACGSGRGGGGIWGGSVCVQASAMRLVAMRQCMHVGSCAPACDDQRRWWRWSTVARADGGDGVCACGWGPTHISRPVATVLHSNDEPTSLVAPVRPICRCCVTTIATR
jgi:hypothetical protein